MSPKGKSFGEVALECVKKCISENSVPSSEIWFEIAKIKGFSDSMAKKGCPKSAFLGLCEEGLVIGIQPGNYTTSRKNKSYAIEAVKILKKDNSLCNKPEELWGKIPGTPTTYNHQMDVVCTLWNENLIVG